MTDTSLELLRFLSLPGIVSLFLSVVCVYTFISAVRLESRRAILIAAFASLAASVVISYLLHNAGCELEISGTGPFVILVTENISLITALMIIISAAEAVLMALLLKKYRNEVTPASIKELFDHLPEGISFSQASGRRILTNLRMQTIRGSVFGDTSISDDKAWARLKAHETADGYQAAGIEGEPIVICPDGSVLQFGKREAFLSGQQINEFTSIDVTGEYRLYREIENNNRALENINKKLREFSRNVVQYSRERETLETKIKIHDETGRMLIAARAFLEQPAEERDKEALIRQWRFNINMLATGTADEETEEQKDLSALYEAAQQTDVRVDLDGALPVDAKLRSLVFSILKECMNNLVRHADGHLMEAHMETNDDIFYIRVTNDGKAPEKEIVPAGGLANLERSISLAGGRMKITSFPEFVFEAEIPGSRLKPSP